DRRVDFALAGQPHPRYQVAPGRIEHVAGARRGVAGIQASPNPVNDVGQIRLGLTHAGRAVCGPIPRMSGGGRTAHAGPGLADLLRGAMRPLLAVAAVVDLPAPRAQITFAHRRSPSIRWSMEPILF